FRGQERDALRGYTEHLHTLGIPGELADWATRILYGFGLLDIVALADSAGRNAAGGNAAGRNAAGGNAAGRNAAGGGSTVGQDTAEVASVYFVVSERFRVDDLLSRI